MYSTQVHAAAALLAHGATGGATSEIGAEELVGAVRALCGADGYTRDASLAAAAIRTTGLLPALLTLIRRALVPPDSVDSLGFGRLGLDAPGEVSSPLREREREHGEMNGPAGIAMSVARPSSPAASTSSEEGEDVSPLPTPPPPQPPPDQQLQQQAEKAGEGTTDLASARAALAGVRATEAAAATAAMALLTEAAEAAEAAGDTDSTLWIAQQVCAMRFCLCVCVALGCIKTGQKRAVYETSKKCTHHRV